MQKNQGYSADAQSRDHLRPRDTKERLTGRAHAVMERLHVAMGKLENQIAKPGSAAALDKLKTKNEDLRTRVSTLLQALQSGKVEDHHLADHDLHYDHDEMQMDCQHHPELEAHFTSLHALASEVHMLDRRVDGYHNHRNSQTGFTAKSHVCMGGQEPFRHSCRHHVPENAARAH